VQGLFIIEDEREIIEAIDGVNRLEFEAVLNGESIWTLEATHCENNGTSTLEVLFFSSCKVTYWELN
jgi:hypothetical protein